MLPQAIERLATVPPGYVQSLLDLEDALGIPHCAARHRAGANRVTPFRGMAIPPFAPARR